VNGRTIAPWVGCDYRTPDGRGRCTDRFGGDKLGESFAEVHRRALAAGWVKGTFAWLREVHPGRLFDLCPIHTHASDATVVRAAADSDRRSATS
jgi:hypothetical protein